MVTEPKFRRKTKRVQEIVLPTSQREARIAVNLLVNGKSPVKAIVDTAADVSFMSEQAWNLFCPGTQLEDTNITARSIQGHSLKVCGRGTLSFTLGSRWWKYNFYVAPELNSPVYLGRDFLTQNGLIIDCARELLLYNREEIPFWTPDPPSSLPREAIDKLIHEKVNSLKLSDVQKEELYALFQEFPGVFNPVTGRSSIMTHSIKLQPNTVPFQRPPYRTSVAKRKIIDNCIKEMKREGIITESSSPWASPVLIVPKKDGGNRFCVDYRELNKRSVADPFPLPRIDDIIETVPKPKFITKLDLRNGYWQVPLDENSQEKSSFITHRGKYKFKVLPFGLMSAPATFQRMMNFVFKDGREHGVFVYLDDILILSSTWEEHLSALRYVLRQLTINNLTLKLSKCDITMPNIKVLGYRLSENGVEIDQNKVKIIQSFPQPQNLAELQRFLGLLGWHQKFVDHYASMTAPLQVLRKKNSPWKWGTDQEQAFVALKKAVAEATLLHTPTPNEPLILTTDASDVGLGVMLSQIQDGVEQPLGYASRLLRPAEKNYSATEKECLAIVWGIDKFRHHLDGTLFHIYTDHHSLCWLLNLKDPNSRLGRWAMKMQQYKFEIHHRTGKSNVVADCLSRIPVEVEQVIINLPNRDPDNLIDIPSMDDIYHAQLNDAKIQQLRQEVNQGINPLYEIGGNGVLFRKGFQQFPRTICLPTALSQNIIQIYHDLPSVGHRGRDTTLNRIREKYTWPGMFKEIKAYVQGCLRCQQFAHKNQKPVGLMGLTRAKQPWDLVGVDLMGPLPLSPKKKRYLLVVVDYFTKWVELVPLPNATAEAITPEWVKIVLRWGSPKGVFSDLGRNFVSALWKAVCAVLGVKTKNTTPYHPASNWTERVNKVIGNTIAKYLGASHRNWDANLTFIQASINTALHASTGYSPYYLNYGRTPRMPWDPLEDNLLLRNIGDQDVETHVREKIQKLQDQRDLAEEFQHLAQERNKLLFDRTRQNKELLIGQLVWRETHHLSDKAKGFMAKLAPKWEGPFLIVNKTSPLTYQLENPITHTSEGQWHIEHLKIFRSRTENQEPEIEEDPDFDDERPVSETSDVREDLDIDDEAPEPHQDITDNPNQPGPITDNPFVRPLELGWKRKIKYRSKPSPQGRTFDVYYISPSENTFRSKIALQYYLSINPVPNLSIENFSFTRGPIGHRAEVVIV